MSFQTSSILILDRYIGVFRRFLFCLPCLAFSLCLQNCKKEKDASEKPDPLHIEYFYQDADTIGGTVMIVGKGFSLDPANNKILFNITATKPFYSSHDTLLVKVPQGATTGKIQVEVYSQTVLSKGIFNVVSGHWKKMSDFPGSARTGAVGFSIGDKGYVVLGLGAAGGEYKHLWEYNDVNNAWTKKAEFPGPDRIEAFCFVINNKAYVGGGNKADNYATNDLYEYDPGSNTWSTKTAFPFPIAFSDAVGFSINGKGYVVNGSSTKVVYEYNPQSDMWVKKADFPGQCGWRGAGFVIGDRGYIVSGYGEYGVTKECWEYNPVTDSWVQKTSLPEALVDPVGFSINENGFVGNGSTRTRMLWRYDPQADKWEQKTNIPGNPTAQAASFVIGNKAYLQAAYYQNNLTNEIWQFEP